MSDRGNNFVGATAALQMEAINVETATMYCEVVATE